MNLLKLFKVTQKHLLKCKPKSRVQQNKPCRKSVEKSAKLSMVLQHILILCVGWIFITRKQLDNGLGQLEIVRNSIGVVLLPILVIMVWINNPLFSWILLGIIGTIFLLLALTKSIQLFYKNILSLFYILLYITCLELIPMGSILLWTQHILQ